MSPLIAFLLLDLLIAPTALLARKLDKPGHVVRVEIPAEGREVGATGVVQMRAERRPCSCVSGTCSCCTGVLLEQFNQRGCMKLSYEPDDFMFVLSMSMNDKTVYKNAISGKNPAPVCVPMPRFPNFKLCVRLSNVFLEKRNIHACVDMEARFAESKLFNLSFDCMRLGANGVALLKPEDGGGLGTGGGDDYDVGPIDGEDYDVEGVGGPEDETTLPSITELANNATVTP